MPGGQRQAAIVVDRKPHRQALHHLHPVAGGIFRRQQREARAGARAGGKHRALESLAGIGVHREARLLAGPHMGEVGFLEIGFHPHIAVAHQREQGRGGIDVVAHLDLVHLGDDAVHRRMHHGVGQIPAARDRARPEPGAPGAGFRPWRWHRRPDRPARWRSAVRWRRAAAGRTGNCCLAWSSWAREEMPCACNSVWRSGFALLIGEGAFRRRFIGQPLAIDRLQRGHLQHGRGQLGAGIGTAILKRGVSRRNSTSPFLTC